MTMLIKCSFPYVPGLGGPKYDIVKKVKTLYSIGSSNRCCAYLSYLSFPINHTHNAHRKTETKIVGHLAHICCVCT